jgi:uncharacterized repeat protein (TIGR03803 family)
MAGGHGLALLKSAHRRSWGRRAADAAVLCVLAALSGCMGEGCSIFGSVCEVSSGSRNVAVQTYALGARISGLDSPGLVLLINGAQMSVAAGASSQTLASALPSGAGYAVAVQTQPVGEDCIIADGTGTIGSGNATDVVVSCSDQSYTVGGAISGLISSGLVLADGGDTLTVSAGASSFTMPTAVAYTGAYAVTVQRQPVGLNCVVSTGAGTMGGAAVTNVAVTCLPNTYTVGGSITGLTADGLVLLDNGGDAITLGAGATQFTMSTGVAYGSAYAITVPTAPSGLVCSVSNGTGTMAAADVTSVNIGCMPNFTLLYAFAGGSSDGADPYHSLILAGDGNFYGTTLHGGAGNTGTIFEISPSGVESLLFSFAAVPYAGLIQGSDGNFYGTTATGGSNNRGTVFEVTPGGVQTILYSFPAGSSDPYCGLIQGNDGNFYGTTGAGGGNDAGTVFEITPGGTRTVLHAFAKTGSDGQTPYAGLIQGSDGNFYGTTYTGGSAGFGTVFKVTPDGTETVLHSFAGGGDGANPYAGVVQGSDGNFYGTTYAGGDNGLGTVFRLTPGGTETVLYSFAGGGSDGANPEAGLIQASDGNFYGMTYRGGSSGLGTVFKLTPAGTEAVLHAFAGSSDGANPWADLVQGSDGNLYGSTFTGGAGAHGTFFKIILQ